MGVATPVLRAPNSHLSTYLSFTLLQPRVVGFSVLPCQGSSTQLCSCPHLGVLAFRMIQHLLGGCGCSFLLVETDIYTGCMPRSPEMRLL